MMTDEKIAAVEACGRQADEDLVGAWLWFGNFPDLNTRCSV